MHILFTVRLQIELRYKQGRRCVYSPDGSTFFAWNDVISKIRLHQLMRIYLKTNPAKFRSNSIWNDGALGFFDEAAPNNKKKTYLFACLLKGELNPKIKLDWNDSFCTL